MELRRVLKWGHSRVLVLPRHWLDLLEREGGPVAELEVRVDGDTLVARPYRQGTARVEVTGGHV